MNLSARVACVAASLVAAGCPITLFAQTGTAPSTDRAVESLRLGTVEFPTSGVAAAQPHFVYGVAALHSFWYEEALEAFAHATEIDPQFAMAYWGEAMCYYRTFRPGTDLVAGRRALGKIKDTSALTARERGYIEALRTLYGQTGNANPAAYATAMEKLRLAHPEDREAAAFHALALLARGTLENRDKAGEIAREVYRQNPNHPGAAHYIIHSYDDPQRADRALEAAQHYAKIAPDAPHALHMPSHIFLQLGMWDEAFSSNELGWTASVDYVKRKALAPTMRDYHNLHWQIYALLQQGRYGRAGEFVEEFVRMRTKGELAPVSARYIDTALANYVTDTRHWDRADELFTAASQPAAAGPRGGEVELCGVAPVATPQPQKKQAPNPLADTGTFLRAYAAAARGVAPAGGQTLPGLRDRVALLEAIAAAHAKNFDRAIAVLSPQAAAEAIRAKPVGPPVSKPTHELFGEILLSAGKPQEAVAQFKIALERHPGRALSLLGLGRAEAAVGNKTAARVTYRRLLEIWKHADADLPELAEVKAFVRANG